LLTVRLAYLHMLHFLHFGMITRIIGENSPFTGQNYSSLYSSEDSAVCARTRTPSVILTEKGKVGMDWFQNEIMAFPTNSTKIVNEYFTFSE
jgi:hypothetical protein